MIKNYKKYLVLISVVLFVFVAIVFLFTYVFQLQVPAIKTVQKFLHLPALIVDGNWISLTEIEDDVNSIKQFYENQDFSKFGIRVDFDTPDGKKRLKIQERRMLNKLVEDTAIAEIAKEWGISVSDEAVKTAMERPMKETGSEEAVKTRLKDLYGWSLDEFGDKVVYKQLLRDRVIEEFNKRNKITDDMRKRINDAKKELDDGRDFADVAKKYSEGSSAQTGGIMGWFNEFQLQDEIGKKVFELPKGEYTDIIETPIGLHIVKVNDIMDTDGKKLVHVSQIVVKKQTFADFLSDKIKQMTVNIFIPEYKWDAESGFIVFVDDDMIKFEEEVTKENSYGDIFEFDKEKT